MSMFSIFNVSGSAVSAQSQRLNVVASITAWTKVMKVDDFLPWKRKGNEE